MPSKEQMIEALKDNCGGTCLIDPENCKCFETPTQEMADDIGVDLEDMDDINEAWECLHYQNISYYIKKDEDFIFDTTVEYLVKSESLEITEDDAKMFVNKCFDDGMSVLSTMTKGFFVFMKREANTNLIRNNKGYIYLLVSSDCVKIGRSKKPRGRTEHLKTLVPFDIAFVKHYEVEDYVKAETYLHRYFKDQRLNGEWFSVKKEDISEVIDVVCGDPINGVECYC